MSLRLHQICVFHRVNWLAVGALLVGLADYGGAQNRARANDEIPKSVFIDDIKVGRDPFFPNTARRSGKPRVAAIPNDGLTPSPSKNFSDQIKLKGILGSATRRLVLINNHTFAVGEQAEVKTSDGKVRVRCVEIRERSVIVTLPGDTQRRELYLNEKL
jgi:hypothetical protein